MYFFMQNYPVTRERDQTDWLDPLVRNLNWNNSWDSRLWEKATRSYWIWNPHKPLMQNLSLRVFFFFRQKASSSHGWQTVDCWCHTFRGTCHDLFNIAGFDCDHETWSYEPLELNLTHTNRQTYAYQVVPNLTFI